MLVELGDGLRYIIETDVSDRERWERLIERLTQPPGYDGSFRVEFVEGGVYFCEDARSAVSAVALRTLIDEVLFRGPSVVIREAG
jgi:hypothetical protein